MTEEQKTEPTTDEPVYTIDIEDVAKKVARSFYAATCMILGTNQEVYDKYLEWGMSKNEDEQIFIVVGEKASEDCLQLLFPVEVALANDDRPYFQKMKEFARIMVPHIPAEMIQIPKDEWPEPVWKDPEEEVPEEPKD